jgi:hypothetical protein
VIGGLGLWSVAMVRPHMAGLIAVCLAAAVVMRRSSGTLRELTPIVRAGSIVAVAVLAAIMVVRTDRFLADSGIDTSAGVETALVDIQDRTSRGGSEFVPSVLDSPVRAPMAVVTVLFRPFVFEAHNAQSFLAAIEGTVLLAMFLLRWRWFAAAMRCLRSRPYVMFCLAFTVLFLVAYSSFANFGLLARERVQLYPLFLVLISIAPARQGSGSSVPDRAEARR